MNLARNPNIAIEGVIGVGKTTLARMLQPELNAQIVLEVFEENPFLSDFYGDRDRYAFQTQLFFLLSRYRQQTTTIPEALSKGPIVTDYFFAKDRLFAHLNLDGDELAMYERVYAALGERIFKPDLIVYLRADLNILLQRITARDRPYERNMDPDYIEQLRLAYEDFFNDYDETTVLVLDTSDLDFVKNADDYDLLKQRILSSLEFGTYQAQLPGVDVTTTTRPEAILEELESGSRQLSHFQHFHRSLDADKGFDPDFFFNFIALQEEMGELARVLKSLWQTQRTLEGSGGSVEESHIKAISQHRSEIQDELADCLAYLLKLSNYAGIDLEKAYLDKMTVNAKRHWQNGHMLHEDS